MQENTIEMIIHSNDLKIWFKKYSGICIFTFENTDLNKIYDFSLEESFIRNINKLFRKIPYNIIIYGNNNTKTIIKYFRSTDSVTIQQFDYTTNILHSYINLKSSHRKLLFDWIYSYTSM